MSATVPMISKAMLDSIREDFPALKKKRNGLPPIYLDNACTTLVPKQVIDAINEYYTTYPACGEGRSRYWFAEDVTCRIEGDSGKGIKGSRQIIREFINARSEKEIIFTSNTTHAINIVALGFRFKPGDVVLLTDKEHNSNLVPWLRLQGKGLIKLDHVDSTQDDIFDLENLKYKLANRKVRLVSMAYSSNLTGYTIPAKDIIKIAHDYGIKVLLDGAQTVPHKTVDVQDLDVDFLAFSIHKMCGPKGVGILYGKREFLGQKLHESDETPDVIEPTILGGGTVTETTYDSYSLLNPPERFEAGIQDYPGQIAAGSAIEYLQRIGMNRINSQENQLNHFLTEQLLNRYGETGWFKILGPHDSSQRGGILTFEIKRPNALGIAEELSKKSNVMIRDGAFCVHSFLNKKFGQGWMRPGLPQEHRMLYRVSLYFYNTMDECQIFLETLNEIFEERSYV
ncbi:MAG: Aminotran 5 protein [Thermoproteota archaeon]|nr:Aminotran 5 protein [Thermoproteota archaeon]